MDSDAWEIAEGFDSFVVLSSSGPELPLEIHRRWPTKQVIARLYWPPGDLPAVDEALEVWVPYIKATMDVIHRYQILNEPDTEYPNMLPETFADWFIHARNRLKEALSA